MTDSQFDRRTPLAGFSGTLVLVGAGKMGGALLEGWLGARPRRRQVVVIEPQPARDIAALAQRGLRLNPTAADRPGPDCARHRGQAAGRARGRARAPPFVGRDGRRLDHGRPHAASSGTGAAGAAVVRAMPNTPAAIGRGITVAVPNARVSAPQRALVAYAAVGDRRGRVDRRRGADGRRDGGVGLGARLRLPAGRGAGARRRRRRSAGRARREARARHGRGLGRTAASLAAAGRDLAPERDLARRHHRRRARRADGQGRPRSADDQGDRRRHPALARAFTNSTWMARRTGSSRATSSSTR